MMMRSKSRDLATFLTTLALAAPSLGNLSACTRAATPETAPRKLASSSDLPAAELGEVWGPDNEAQTAEVLADTRAMLLKRSEGASFIRRDAHPKHHGCVKAFFKIDASALPAELRTGIFAASPGTSSGAAGAPVEYPAWIRFSNGSPDGITAPDITKDMRGMAIKLMNVEGAKSGSQDFVLCTSKEFFSENGADYVALHRALGGPKAGLLWYLGTHLRDALILKDAEIQIGNSLQTEYYSALPYKLGNGSMKFEVRPCASDTPADTVPGKDAAPGYLRERLVSTLGTRPACFDFFVQPNRNPEKQPVENPTVAWDDQISPLIKVATITIPQQNAIDSAEHLNFAKT